eukprot:3811870-Pleurochrysis_carterae.AAC.2
MLKVHMAILDRLFYNCLPLCPRRLTVCSIASGERGRRYLFRALAARAARGAALVGPHALHRRHLQGAAR